MESLLFTPAKIGPIEIKNRVIRASAYEGMCDGHVPTQQLKDYHTAVARGGVGMTSVAYASINKSGLSFHRMKFMDMVMEEVMKAAGDDIAVLVKTNTRDGFKGGLEVEDCIKVAKRLEQDGAHCLVLSGGFVSRAPMYVMRGAMPISVLTGYMPWRLWWLKMGVNLFGKMMIKDEPFKEAFFFDDSIRFRRELKMPLAFVGGVNSMATINRVLDAGFEFVEMARPLVYDTDFVNKLRDGVCTESGCRHANYCVARIWNYDMQCHENCKLSPRMKREVERNIKKYYHNG